MEKMVLSLGYRLLANILQKLVFNRFAHHILSVEEIGEASIPGLPARIKLNHAAIHCIPLGF